MEDNFDKYLIKLARNCRTRYRCFYGGRNCGAIFHIEEEMVQHLGRNELDGGHETEMLNGYNLFNGNLADEASIGRAISEEEVASNSEEGDDPLCISTAEKRKAIVMELTWPRGPPFKRSRYLKNVVEESTVVAYEMKEHVPTAEDVLFMDEDEDDFFMRLAHRELMDGYSILALVEAAEKPTEKPTLDDIMRQIWGIRSS